MKISQEEIDAAWGHASITWHIDTKRFMERALEAAYTVRKQRKAAKRERQRKEKDNTIQKSAADMMTWCGKTLPEMTTDELVSARDELAGFESMSLRENGFYHRMNAEIMARKEKDKQVVESVKPENYYGFATGVPLNRLFPEITPFQAPEWDGKFGLGKWQTRNGGRAVVDYVMSDGDALRGKAYGFHTVIWKMNGSVNDSNSLDPLDLIRPWPKGEQ